MGFWDKGDFAFEKRDRSHMENLYGDVIERCPSPEFVVLHWRDVQFER